MASFNTVMTAAGATALANALNTGGKIFPDFALAGSGVFPGPQEDVTALVSPVDVDIQVVDRELVEASDGEPPKLLVVVNITNAGITEPTPIRELLLLANSNGGADLTNAVPFAYAWLDDPGTDNILSPPPDPNKYNTVHTHKMALVVTNQEMAHIEVSFTLNGGATIRYVNEEIARLEGLIRQMMPRFEGSTLVFGE